MTLNDREPPKMGGLAFFSVI